ncbi:MAG: 3-oxoacyl-[acyl-carrier-protein] synthase 3 [Syntrophus sp. SKADARSKE-3]|nr:3-oxoacyl-[acyl-carrier-protein] synthase 3 [Syntrophus sp. SKADARSKE-3]
MSDKAYITRTASFMPNEPVVNDDMEGILGTINGKPSRGRRIVLKSNGIKTRHYATTDGETFTHTNAELAANAVRGILNSAFGLDNMELLCCGTSIPDQLLPSHAAMVHGCLGGPVMEIISPAGVCCSGMHAMKYGMLSVMSGNTSNAVCSGSELASPHLLARNFESEMANLSTLESRPILAFEKDFLRWMLSDGAGAALLQAQPNGPDAISLRIDWIDTYSFAGQIETCMYAGADRNGDGAMRGWTTYRPQEWLEKSIFAIKQDVGLLDQHVVRFGAEKIAESLCKRGIPASDVDYFLPHISSEYFRMPLHNEMRDRGAEIPQDRWFTNLSRVGNVGSASIYLMLDELFHSGKLDHGMKVYVFVPESARFNYALMMLTVC